MKQIVFAALTASLLSSSCAIAKDQYYAKANIGAGYVPNQKTTRLSDSYIVKSKGYGVFGILGLGYKMSSYNMRSDLEFYFDSGLKGNRGIYHTKVNTYAGFWNLYYDFTNASKFTPYVQAGLGYATNKYKFSDNSNSYSKSKGGVAYKFGLGTTYKISNNFDTEFGYFYMNKGVKKNTFYNNRAAAYRSKTVAGQVHGFTAGLRVSY